MAGKRAQTIAEYIESAPAVGQPYLRRLHALLKDIAPSATETIKWGYPFFVEPRFLFAFSAHKAHISFAPHEKAMEHFREELTSYETTKLTLKVRYSEDLPEDLIRRMAEYCLQYVGGREDSSFW